MGHQRRRRVVDRDARHGDDAALATGESGTLPDMAEDEVEDAGLRVGRVGWRRRHEVDVSELLRAALEPSPPVVVAQRVVVEMRPWPNLFAALLPDAGPLLADHAFDV